MMPTASSDAVRAPKTRLKYAGSGRYAKLPKGSEWQALQKPLPQADALWLLQQKIDVTRSRQVFFCTPVLHWKGWGIEPEDDPILEAIRSRAGSTFKRRHLMDKVARAEVREVFRWLRRAWVSVMNANTGRLDLAQYCFANSTIVWSKAFVTPFLDKAALTVLAEQQRCFDGIAAHGLKPDWAEGIKAAISAHPDVSNRVLGKIAGCSEATIRRYKERQKK